MAFLLHMNVKDSEPHCYIYGGKQYSGGRGERRNNRNMQREICRYSDRASAQLMVKLTNYQDPDKS